MTNFTDITLALDLSLTSPGFAVLAVTEGKPIVLEVSHVKTDAKRPHGARLASIAVEIDRLMKAYSPEHVVREKGFSRFPAVTQTLFKVVGLSDFVLNHFDVYIDKDGEISPTSVKKSVTGDGKATKEQVAEAVFELLRIENKDDFYTDKGVLIDDRTDAAAVGLAYLKRKGLIAE